MPSSQCSSNTAQHPFSYLISENTFNCAPNRTESNEILGQCSGSNGQHGLAPIMGWIISDVRTTGALWPCTMLYTPKPSPLSLGWLPLDSPGLLSLFPTTPMHSRILSAAPQRGSVSAVGTDLRLPSPLPSVVPLASSSRRPAPLRIRVHACTAP